MNAIVTDDNKISTIEIKLLITAYWVLKTTTTATINNDKVLFVMRTIEIDDKRTTEQLKTQSHCMQFHWGHYLI